MNLVLFEPGEVGPDGDVDVTGARAAHLTRVLGVTPGREVRVGVLDGPTGHGRVERVEAGRVVLRCAFTGEAPPCPAVDVLLALPRPKVLRRLWAPLAALGVGRIILTSAEKVERDYFDARSLAPDTYRPLLVEGLAQARDTRVPVVSVHRRFRVLVEDELDGLVPPLGACRLVAHPGTAASVREALGARPVSEPARALIAVGPEGGWNPFELALLCGRGFRAVSMGPRALRSDTAVVALTALVHDGLAPAGVNRR